MGMNTRQPRKALVALAPLASPSYKLMNTIEYCYILDHSYWMLLELCLPT